MSTNNIYIEDFFQNIVNDIISDVSGTISSISDKTLTVNKTTGLSIGMLINLNGYKEPFEIESLTTYSITIKSNLTSISATTYSLNLNYIFGHPIEIANILTEKDQNSNYKYKKYPCLCLFTGIDEEIGNFEPNCKSFNNIFLAIITDTKPSYSTSQRKELKFKKILEPIYFLLFNKLENCKYTYKLIKPESRVFQHVKHNVYFYGSEGKEQNILNSFADAIEIKNLQLRFYY